MDDVPFVVEIDSLEGLPGRFLIDQEQIAVIAIEVARSFASRATAMPGQKMAAHLSFKNICTGSARPGRSPLRPGIPRSLQETESAPVLLVRRRCVLSAQEPGTYGRKDRYSGHDFDPPGCAILGTHH